MTRLHKLLLGAAGVGILSFGATTAGYAATILSDAFVVFNGKGQVKFEVTAPENSSEISSHLYIFKVGNPGINPAMLGLATILTERGAPGTISDVFGICACGGSGGKALALAFQSDGSTPLTPSSKWDLTRPITLREITAGPYNATEYLSPKLTALGWTAEFFSDVDVPEPATWALMLAGFGMAGGALRYRSRVRATA
jgi:PEP-CTERM motif